MKQISQIMSEQQRTGKRYRPNANNPVTAHRHKVNKLIRDVAANQGVGIEVAALHLVRQHEPQIRRYVSRRGEMPLNNPVELSVQAAALAAKEAEQVSKDLNLSLEQAQMVIDENESSGYEMNPNESDEFIGSILGAIGAVAHKGVTKIAEKKQAKGKPAKFWSWLADLTKPREEVPYSYGMDQPNVLDGVKVAVGDVLSDIKNRERQAEIKKMLPLLLVAALAIILVTVLITKNGK